MTTITFATIATAINDYRIASQKRYDMAIDKIKLDNDGKEPTLGIDGRLHAPCDGYVVNEVMYLGGQYLPTFDEDAGSSIKDYKIRIKSALYNADAIKSLFGHDVTHGKTWLVNNIEVAYFYVVVNQAEKNILERIIPESGKILILADDSTPAKKFKFSWAKAEANISFKTNRLYDPEFFSHLMMQQYGLNVYDGWQYEPGRKVKGKLRESYHIWDGLMVEFSYIDNTVY